MAYLEGLDEQAFEARMRTDPVISREGPIESGDPWFDEQERIHYEQLAFEASDGK